MAAMTDHLTVDMLAVLRVELLKQEAAGNEIEGKKESEDIL